MAMEKISISVDPELLEEARQRAGQRGMSKFMNEALKYYLQALRIREFEAELAAHYGPISEEAKKRVAEIEWIA
jgi:metal-responsive CopG/Arc/MetJ family transcriptional regulator